MIRYPAFGLRSTATVTRADAVHVPCRSALRVLHYSAVAVNPSTMETVLFRAGIIAAATALLAGTLSCQPARATLATAAYWPTRPGIAVRVLLMNANRPADAVMLLPGGHGNINLDGAGHIGWGKDDYVIRTHDHFFNRGIAGIVPDVASDHKPPVSLAGYRTSEQQAEDLSALADHLHSMAPKVWIVAYDTGATSALNAVARGKAAQIAGLVLISPILEEPQQNSTPLLDGAKLAMSRIPVLVIAHTADACSAPDVARLKQAAEAVKAAKFQVLTVRGGSSRFLLQEPFGFPEGSCEAQPAHALAGLDNAVADKIVDWIHDEGSSVLESLSDTPTDIASSGTAPLTQVTPISALPEPSAAGFRWTTVRGLNIQAVNTAAIIPDQPVLRLTATPDDNGHTLAARLTGLDKGRTYRIAAWVKPIAEGNVGLFAFDTPDGNRPPNTGYALFDLGGHEVLEAVGVKERDIEQHADSWQKVWIELPTSDGNFLVAVRPANGKNYEFDGDGKIGVILGGIEAKPAD